MKHFHSAEYSLLWSLRNLNFWHVLYSYVNDSLMLDPKLFIKDAQLVVDLTAAVVPAIAPTALPPTSTPTDDMGSTPADSTADAHADSTVPNGISSTHKTNDPLSLYLNGPPEENTLATPQPDTPITEDLDPSISGVLSQKGNADPDNQDPNIPNIVPGQETRLPPHRHRSDKRKRQRSGDEQNLAKMLGQADATRLAVVRSSSDDSIETDGRPKDVDGTPPVAPGPSSKSSTTLMHPSTETSDMASTIRAEPV
jgi:hypothetical protein